MYQSFDVVIDTIIHYELKIQVDTNVYTLCPKSPPPPPLFCFINGNRHIICFGESLYRTIERNKKYLSIKVVNHHLQIGGKSRIWRSFKYNGANQRSLSLFYPTQRPILNFEFYFCKFYSYGAVFNVIKPPLVCKLTFTIRMAAMLG